MSSPSLRNLYVGEKLLTTEARNEEDTKKWDGLMYPHFRVSVVDLDGLVKSPESRHPGESRGPELVELTGYRLSPV
jgi:hypothetical protein